MRCHMKIVSWNANGKFREKFKAILELDADVYVIQECENPETCRNKEYRDVFKSYHWTGSLSYKGLMVCTTRPDISIERLDWGADGRRFFMPVRINDSFNLVAAWACDPYYEELQGWIEAVFERIDSKTVIIGDLNSSVVFDRKYPRKPGRSFGDVIVMLESKGLLPMWHHHHREEQGSETAPTFFLHRHLDKPYHIDHCFADPELVISIIIHARWQWLSHSDHLPVEISAEA